MSNASFLTQLLRQVAVYGLIIFSLLMIIAGLLGVYFGRLSVGHIKI